MATKKNAPEPDEAANEPLPMDLASILARKRTDPVVENGREFAYGKVPYYVKGKRVTHAEYVAHQRAELKKATKAELAEAAAAGLSDIIPDPPADQATSKE